MEREGGLTYRVGRLEKAVEDLGERIESWEKRDDEAWATHRREFEASKRFVATVIISASGVVVAALGVLIVLLSGGT